MAHIPLVLNLRGLVSLLHRMITWCRNIGIEVSKVGKSSSVCSDHFSTSQFMNRNRFRLKRSAEPYITNPGLLAIASGAAKSSQETGADVGNISNADAATDQDSGSVSSSTCDLRG